MDRWIYVFMAGMFVVVALGGFIPDSIRKVAEIDTGPRRPFSALLHVHAVLMGSWLLVLLAQALLMAMGRKSLHRTLGLTSLVLGPAVVAVMIVVSVEGWGSLYSAPPALPAGGLAQMKYGIANALLAQGRAVVYFSLFFLRAIWMRGKDRETHKRMMILATLVLIPAAIARMRWLPTAMPGTFDAVNAYMLLCLVPALFADVIRFGRPHRAYLVGLALLSPCLIATHYLWNSPWWLATASKLIFRFQP